MFSGSFAAFVEPSVPTGLNAAKRSPNPLLSSWARESEKAESPRSKPARYSSLAEVSIARTHLFESNQWIFGEGVQT
eukprot:m.182634 g.182634  ORF g.182634 m.182634 type:complete len:77 (-) comp14979_c0_seq1:25-255(-)